MTKCNYTGTSRNCCSGNIETLNDSEFIDLLNGFDVRVDQLTLFLKRHHPNILQEFLNRTSFLDRHFIKRNIHVPTKARLYCLQHGLKYHPICQNPKCTNTDNTVGWDCKSGEFNNYCCVKCMANDAKIKQQIKETNIKRFGVEYPMQSLDIMEKGYQTNLVLRGVRHPSQCDEVKEKMKQTCLKNNGVEWAMQSNEVKQKSKITSLKHFGVSHPMKSEQVKKHLEQTMVSHYGVSNFSQSSLFTGYYRKRVFYDGYWFDSSWEVIVYKYLKQNNIEFVSHPQIVFDYEYEGKVHKYHPDFQVGDKIIEVKGDQFFRVNNKTGIEEMYCPFRRKEWTNEKYDYECGKFEAKHQCMLDNNVIIIREKQIFNLDSIFGKQIMQ